MPRKNKEDRPRRSVEGTLHRRKKITQMLEEFQKNPTDKTR